MKKVQFNFIAAYRFSHKTLSSKKSEANSKKIQGEIY